MGIRVARGYFEQETPHSRGAGLRASQIRADQAWHLPRRIACKQFRAVQPRSRIFFVWGWTVKSLIFFLEANSGGVVSPGAWEHSCPGDFIVLVSGDTPSQLAGPGCLPDQVRLFSPQGRACSPRQGRVGWFSHAQPVSSQRVHFIDHTRRNGSGSGSWISWYRPSCRSTKSSR
jgi:hypothetical protein